MQLSAAAEKTTDGSAREALLRSASAIRASVKTLRSAIVGVYPPNLRQQGLATALSDLLGRLGSHGIETRLQIDDRARFDADVEELLYRACQEGVRNVEQHAGARHVRVVVRPEDGRAILEVADDGRGLPTDRTADTDGAHMGLEILENVIGDAGGRLSVARGDDGRGTVLRAEVPTE
jgi:signal transduction histidine kinase